MRTFTVFGRRPTAEEQRLIDTAVKLRADWITANNVTASSARRCAHSVTGRLHPSDQWRDPAICHPPGWDHAEIWNLPRRRGRVLVYHPYSPPDPEDLLIFDAWWGTTTTVHERDESWYWPGVTWRLEVRRA